MSNEELLARIDERQKALTDRLDAILEQTIKTNGRVTRSEEKIIDLEKWQSESRGNWKGVVTVSTIIGIIIGYITNVLAR